MFFIHELSKWPIVSSLIRSILKLGGPVHCGFRIQQKVFLCDPPCTGVNRNHWEAHLESPAVHDVVDCMRDLKTWCGFNCLKDRVYIAGLWERQPSTHTYILKTTRTTNHGHSFHYVIFTHLLEVIPQVCVYCGGKCKSVQVWLKRAKSGTLG